MMQGNSEKDWHDSRPGMEDAMLPVDFFSVKKTPRGSKLVTRVLAFIVLSLTLVTFVYVAREASIKTFTTTEIKTEDLTGQQGWETCTMVSKVTSSFADAETAGTFNLVNVMESKSKCSANLAASNPCGVVSISDTSGATITDYDIQDLAIDPAGAVYFVFKSTLISGLKTVYKYDPASGMMMNIVDSTTWTDLSSFNTAGSMQISSTGIVYLRVMDSSSYIGTLCWFDPSTATSSSVTEANTLISFALDSADNVWIMTSSQDSENADVTYYIHQYDSTTPSTASAAKTLKFTSSALLNGYYLWGFLSFDASGNLWAVWKTYTQNCILNKIGPNASFPVVSVQLSSPWIHWTGSTSIYQGTVQKYDSNAEPVGTAIVLSDLGNTNRFYEAPSGDIWFIRDSGFPSINKLDTDTGETLSLKSYANGASEWFVCGTDHQAAVPSTEEALNTACALNGVKWSAATTGSASLAFFSDAEYAVFASTCDNTLYTRICDVVGVLPPYVCTKKESTAMTTYLGVAAANAELLYAIVVFLCNFVFAIIPYYKKMRQEPESSTGDVETEVELTHFGRGSLKEASNSALEVAMSMMKGEMAVMKKESEAKGEKIAIMEKELNTIKDQLIMILPLLSPGSPI